MSTIAELPPSDAQDFPAPPPTYRKADIPKLDAGMPAEDALAAIVLSCVDHLRANEACVLERTHEEGIHQMRVATRRLRSCLSLFRDLLPAEQRGYLDGELRWLIGELGPARDWDVFRLETLASVRKQSAEPMLEDLQTEVERRQRAAYERADAAIRSQRYRGLVMLLGAWAEGRRWRDPAASAPPLPHGLQLPIEAVAHRLLDQLYDDVRRAGRGFAGLDAEARHKLRIQIKKLRYASEFFGSLYPVERVAPFLGDMKRLQDCLGASNDGEVARKLVKELVQGAKGKERARLSFAGGLVIGWHSHVADGREQQIRLAWRRFCRRAPYWSQPRPAEKTPLPAAVEGTVGGPAVESRAIAVNGKGRRRRPAAAGPGSSATGRPALHS